MTRRSHWLAVASVAVLVGSALAWWLTRPAPDAEPASGAVASPSVTATMPAPTLDPIKGPCERAAELPFTPETISIDGVAERAAVIGVPRDSRDVTGVLPISNKAEFAWDRGGIRPGSHRGNVLLNTHTWPDGSALGNAMLDRFDRGDLVVVEGLAGARLCYEVTRRIEVLAADGYEPYYEEDGPPRLAFIVCSGTRSADGEWSHRTIWFARPVR